MSEAPPTVVGYQNIQLVGSGGLGDVYRAVRESTGGQVAIKIVREVGDREATDRRVRRELNALLKLKSHPNVVQIEELVALPTGLALVMEFVEGGSLMDLLQAGGPLSPAQAVAAMADVTRALSDAHALGIVHRDIKPQNVMVGQFGQCKLCDFGIAAVLKDAAYTDRTASLSYRYASPEELDDDPDIGPATDVYSLGVTLRQMLTGETSESRSSQLFEELSNDPKHSDSERSTFALLKKMVTSMTARDAASRPSSVTILSMVRDMERGLGSQRLTSVVPPQAETSVADTQRRNSQPLLAAPTPNSETSGWSAPTIVRQPSQSAAIEVREDAHASESDKHPRSQKSKTGALVVGGVVVAALLVAGIVASTNSDGGSQTSKDSASAETTATVRNPSTTVRSTTTTIQPGPVAKLYKDDDGFNYRFNPCDHPIKLKLNPGGYFSDADIANLESFLTEQSELLSFLTGMTITYDGLTSQQSKDAVVDNSKSILIHFGMPGEGLIPLDEADWRSSSNYTYWPTVTRDGFRALRVYQIHVNAALISYGGQALSNADKRFLMHLLGESLGLSWLSDDDMRAAEPPGDPSSWSREIMYLDSYLGLSNDPPEWGAGDLFGLSQVGVSKGCLT